MRVERQNPPPPVVIPVVEKAPKGAKVEKPTIHIVQILDRSGSMAAQNRYINAVAGINEEIKALKTQPEVNYTLTLFEFDSEHLGARIIQHCNKLKLEEFKGWNPKGPAGMTPLYETVGTVIDKMKATPQDEKVLIKIFTDGGENTSRGRWSSPTAVNALIKEVEARGFTVTFVGTDHDVLAVVNTLGIDLTNTLAHDNTAKGVADAFTTSTVATLSYSKSVLRGEEVTRGFYTKKTANDK